MNLKGKRIIVTGGGGFLGKYIILELIRSGAKKQDIVIPRSKTCDLRSELSCRKLLKGADIVIHAAGNVGGIGKNLKYPATLFYDNLKMGINVLHESMKAKVGKLVIIGTICGYPKYTPIPFKEENFWLGYPEETNAPYGLAKKILLVGSEAYRRQFNFHSIYLLLVNLYGPGDNFNPEESHVIPAIIRKMYEARQSNAPSVTIWGDGTPTREFIYAEDAARAIVRATKLYDKPDPINVGSGQEISIKNLTETIAKYMGYHGKIVWDTGKPNGQPRRILDISKIKKEINFQPLISFREGLRRTIVWYEKHAKSL